MLLQMRRVGVALRVAPDATALAALVDEADIVQVHYWNHPSLTATLRTVTLPPARVLVWCHVLGLHAPQVLTADVARYGDRMVLTSDASAQAEGARAAVAAGIPLSVVPAITDQQRLEGFSARPHDGCVVGYLGVVGPAKMHPRFAEMCAAVTHREARFEVYGGGGGEDGLARRAAELGIADRMAVLGPTEDVRSALAGMDVFGYPLAVDSYATSEKVLQEAMWVGLPPVVLAHGGAAGMVTDGVTGLVADDEAGYASAVDRLVADPALRARLGAAARAHAREVYDPVRQTRAVLTIVDELLATPRRSRPRLPGGDDAPGAAFVRSLGDQAGPFAVSLAGPGAGSTPDTLEQVDQAIASSGDLVARGEGGVVHHRNAHPDDPHLLLWSGLVAAHAGDHDTARHEFVASAACGLGDDRAARYAERLPRT
ncbi:MAG: glycosyltransferase [Acidimicrobiia bacterium]